MAHFAQLDENNNVIQVLVVNNEDIDFENEDVSGTAYLTNLFGGTYKQTSYNTRSGVHTLEGTPFRKNYAGIGMHYDAVRDAFIAPKPHPSWTLDESTCQWQAPIPMPMVDGKDYIWNEETTSWVEIIE